MERTFSVGPFVLTAIVATLLTAATSSAGDSIPASPRDCIGPTFHWNRTGNPVGAGTSDPCGALSGEVAVNHFKDDPGELSCDCVPKTDPCFDDVDGCVAESACFAQLLGAEEADNDDDGSGSGDDDDEADPVDCINAVCADTLARCYESVDCWADLYDLQETIFDATSFDTSTVTSTEGPLAEVTSCIEGNMTEIIDCLENGAELESFLEGSCALKTEADCNEEDEEWDTTDAKCIAAPPTTGTSTVTSTVASTVASTVTTTATSTVTTTATSTVSVTVASTATSSRASSATSTATTTETKRLFHSKHISNTFAVVKLTPKVQAVEYEVNIKLLAEFQKRLAAVTAGNPNPEVTAFTQTAKISGAACAETNTVETQKDACATMKNEVGFSADASTACIVQCNDVADSDDARRGRRQASAFARPGQALPIGLGPHGRRNANTVTAAEFMFMVLAAVGTERVATPTGTAAADFVFEVTTTSGTTITVSAPLSVVEFIAEWDSLLSGDAKSLRKYVHAKIETDGIVVIGEKSVAEGEEGTQKKKKKNRNGAALIGAIVTVLAIGTIGALVASEKLAKPQLKSNKVAAAESGLPDPAQQPRTPTRIQVDNFTPAANLKPSGGGGAEGAESQKSPTITGDIAHLIKATRPGPDVTQV